MAIVIGSLILLTGPFVAPRLLGRYLDHAGFAFQLWRLSPLAIIAGLGGAVTVFCRSGWAIFGLRGPVQHRHALVLAFTLAALTLGAIAVLLIAKLV